MMVLDRPGGKKIQHLIWGDWLRVLPDAGRDGWVKIHARKTDGWVKAEELQRERLLEVVFVDIGQGDGALISTPEDKHLIVRTAAATSGTSTRSSAIRTERWSTARNTTDGETPPGAPA
jgi:hypothetical protein